VPSALVKQKAPLPQSSSFVQPRVQNHASSGTLGTPPVQIKSDPASPVHGAPPGSQYAPTPFSFPTVPGFTQFLDGSRTWASPPASVAALVEDDEQPEKTSAKAIAAARSE